MEVAGRTEPRTSIGPGATVREATKRAIRSVSRLAAERRPTHSHLLEICVGRIFVEATDRGVCPQIRLSNGPGDFLLAQRFTVEADAPSMRKRHSRMRSRGEERNQRFCG